MKKNRQLKWLTEPPQAIQLDIRDFCELELDRFENRTAEPRFGSVFSGTATEPNRQIMDWQYIKRKNRTAEPRFGSGFSGISRTDPVVVNSPHFSLLLTILFQFILLHFSPFYCIPFSSAFFSSSLFSSSLFRSFLFSSFLFSSANFNSTI